MTDPVVESPSENRVRWALGRGAEIVVAAVFLLFAVLKALDVNNFIVAIGQYGVLNNDSLQTIAAMVTLAIETALGVAMLLGWRARRLTLGATAAMLLVFSGLIVYAWQFHGLTDCGCGGPIHMGPKSSLIKNAILLGLCALAWWGVGRQGKAAGAGRLQAARALAAAVLAAGVTFYAYGNVEPPPPPPAAPEKPFAEIKFVDEFGQDWDLSQGDYLVAMLSTTCEHCQGAVAGLNQLGQGLNIPPVVGLCEGTEEQLESFRSLTEPEFPTHLVGTRIFYTFIPNGGAPPQYLLVREGAVVKTWDGKGDKLPTVDEVEEARNAAPAAPAGNSAQGLVNSTTSG